MSRMVVLGASGEGRAGEPCEAEARGVGCRREDGCMDLMLVMGRKNRPRVARSITRCTRHASIRSIHLPVNVPAPLLRTHGPLKKAVCLTYVKDREQPPSGLEQADAEDDREQAKQDHTENAMVVEVAAIFVSAAFEESRRTIDTDAAFEVGLHLFDHLGDALESIFGFFLHTLAKEEADLAWGRALVGIRDLLGVDRRFHHDAHQQFGEVGLVFEIMAEVDEFIQQDAKAVDIAAFVDRIAHRLFGRHVGGGTDQLALLGLKDALAPCVAKFAFDPIDHLLGALGDLGGGELGRVTDLFGDTPIHDLDFAVLADHDIFGFDIAMDVAVFVGEMDRVQDLDKDLDASLERVALVKSRIACPQFFDHTRERLALHELHREIVVVVVVDPDIMDRNDVGMFELSDSLDFFEKAHDLRSVAAIFFDPFHGDHAADIVVFDQDDFASAAFSELF